MDKFHEHTGIAAPMKVADVDTDQIIPVRFCSGVDKTGLDAALFADWRESPHFVLNRESFTDSTVLVAGENFGCGSSREWAVWALQAYGFRVVLAPRFGDIFTGNSFKNGLLLVELEQGEIDQIWKEIDENPGTEVSIDLQEQLVRMGDQVFGFTVDPTRRQRLLDGVDDVDLTLQYAADINAYEARRRQSMPTATRITA
ncbi:3-isopropylmalate dehydratase, small subunit [Dietzia kunjamensis subsp. schimae]|uniref:3-isopropylmalate dehydratase small subunit n=1 Tax=Dietzia kunjamensis subsp. schimae TaxID=498198 RepID=A0ABY1MYH4_9ACTN|nr:3-isopropylmalate dehydratase small subunit [Dietzia kunjamensis]MBB1015793.1 3-isopropylmalate dehydratase small subunit [Dietzia kunjamensis subsp. schimae]SMO47291.1 3-isopropylmalate dehydratase, small subunit [Dietzia kunjamensis subsp. schimae]